MPGHITVGKEILASSARTTSSNTSSLLNTANQLPLVPAHVRLLLNCTAFSGTQLDVALEHSPDGGTTWFQHSAFAAVTAAGERELRFKTYHAGGDGAAEQSVATSTGADANDGAIFRDHRLAWSMSGAGASITFGVFASITPVDREF